MVPYTAPLRDMRFVLEELLDFDRIAALRGCEELSRDLADAVMAEAGKFCAEVLFPLNRAGDEEGCVLENGVVRTPTGFVAAYKQFTQAGWTALACDPAYGGQGMPRALGAMVEEMMCSANLSFGMYPGLTHGVYTALHHFGTDGLKALYLPRLVSGEWTGAMCLTEPQCGTDLGLLRTKATPTGDGSYRLSGSKMFITAGDHDLTANIVYLVLGRLPDAPAGIKGVSLFLVPKFIPAADGSPGPRNRVSCGSIEHKMGIKASSTCVINFDEATAWLVGEPHKGMRGMFAMMNEERMAVGVQGLGLGEVSYQSALSYAASRLQGRSLNGTRRPDLPADPIIVHADIRRMLLTMRALNEGCRALSAWVGSQHDIATRSDDAEEATAAADLVALLTPVIKAFLTDAGFEVANLGVQVFGGHGYIRDNGMEQYVRDARITQIYEGTNGIQALDLVGRKLPDHTGRLLRRFFHPVENFIAAHRDAPAMAAYIGPLAKAFARLQQATMLIAQRGLKRPDDAAAVANEYLALFGYVALAFLWARMAEIALRQQHGAEAAFYRDKLETADFYMNRVLPRVHSLFAVIATSYIVPEIRAA